MAIKHNYSQFIASVKIDVKKRELQDVETVKRLAFETFTDIINRGPVDTGLFRSAHALTITAPSVVKPKVIRRSAGTSGPLTTATREAQAKTSLAFIKTLESRRIFITNNLDYAQTLEHGHSDQAPNGVYRLAAMRTQQKINALK